MEVMIILSYFKVWNDICNYIIYDKVPMGFAKSDVVSVHKHYSQINSLSLRDIAVIFKSQ